MGSAKPIGGPADPEVWGGLRSPSLGEFEAIADRAFERLPQGFRQMCEGVIIQIAEFPDEETVDEMELETPFDILGLFRGVGLAQGPAVAETGQFPNMVWLYRRPILDYWAEHDEALGKIIAHVLVHEIGHHFGLSDEDMERIEAEVG
jgi:predicted Zn-dependent protease with MMP-like domain